MYKMSAKKISNRKWINICISVMRCSITEKALVCKTCILREKKTNELVMVLNIILLLHLLCAIIKDDFDLAF